MLRRSTKLVTFLVLAGSAAAASAQDAGNAKAPAAEEKKHSLQPGDLLYQPSQGTFVIQTAVGQSGADVKLDDLKVETTQQSISQGVYYGLTRDLHIGAEWSYAFGEGKVAVGPLVGKSKSNGLANPEISLNYSTWHKGFNLRAGASATVNAGSKTIKENHNTYAYYLAAGIQAGPTSLALAAETGKTTEEGAKAGYAGSLWSQTKLSSHLAFDLTLAQETTFLFDEKLAINLVQAGLTVNIDKNASLSGSYSQQTGKIDINNVDLKADGSSYSLAYTRAL